MDKPKGGRGRTAPYETKQMRVPVGLEDQIQELIDRYRRWIPEPQSVVVSTNNPPRLLDKAVDNFSDAGRGGTEELSHPKLVDKYEAEIEELNLLVDSFRDEVDQMRSQLSFQETLVAQVRQERDDLGEMLERSLSQSSHLRQEFVALQETQELSQPCPTSSINPKAIALLKEALTLRANAGGAIKRSY